MSINGFRRAMIVAGGMTALLGACASTPQPISVQSKGTSGLAPMHTTPATAAQPVFSFGSMLRDTGHGIADGVSWLFPVPSGVYGPPEEVAYGSARAWRDSTGSTGCRLKCDRVERNSVSPIN
jgi:hypothetical protein